MCGIAGIVSFKNATHVNAPLIQKITQVVSHRGPDNLGSYVSDNFAFGHTRLSIIDLSAEANQPMQNINGDVFITYNGEIYNFHEIQKELEKLGHKFSTSSDTEVILHSYEEWGIECIKKFNGMFAFGLFDSRKKIFYLVRDRFGIKPVYYFCSEDTLFFCSEIKGLLEVPIYKREINLKGVSDFLSFRQTIPPETLFKNIFLLQPASFLELTGSTPKISTYWQLDSKQKRRISKKEKDQTKSLLEDAVKKTLIADVPIVAYLSGGIDSSIIASIASKQSPIPTVTVDFENADYSEKKYATLIASKLGIENTTVSISRKEYLENIVKLIRYKDQPLGMHNEVALYLLAKEAKKKGKLALSGEGSDELFGGYGRIFRLPFEFYKERTLNFLRLQNKKNQTFFEYFINTYAYFPFQEKTALFNEKMNATIENDQASLQQLKSLFEESPIKSLQSKVFHFFQRFHLHGLLTMMDSTSMAIGLEVRFPFVDHRLIEKVFSFPMKNKIKWKSTLALFRSLFKKPNEYSEKEDETKSLLKELFALELPPEIISREKMVFPVPLREWLGGEFIAQTTQELLADTSHCSLIFDLEKLKDWICKKEEESDSLYGRKIWLILNLELWLREYFPGER